MQLSAQTILLGATPRTKLEAIELAGLTLVDAGLIERAYIKSMVERELHADTFLGRGIAIPHGMAPDRHLINQTGVSVVQIPRGVEWNKGERVDLVVAIAAKSDEHLHILAALTDVLDDQALIERLSQTTRVEDIVAALGGKAQSTPNANVDFDGQSIEARVGGHAGLHARPAARLSEIASKFESQIHLEYGNRSVSAKSVISLIKLGVASGETVRLVANGTDAVLALSTLKREIESGLGENSNEPAPTSPLQSVIFVPSSGAPFVQGITAAPGFAIAPLHFLCESTISVPDVGSDFDTEYEKLDSALAFSCDELQNLASTVESRGAHEESAIFTAQLVFQEDPTIRSDVKNLLRAGHGAAWSWHTVIQHRADEMRANSNGHLAQRSADLLDVGTRVLRFLGVTEKQNELPDHPVILVAKDFTPSQVAQLDPERVVGLCTTEGGPTSHAAIIARSLSIPLVVALGREVLELPNETSACVLDANEGRLFMQPTEADLGVARKFQSALYSQGNEVLSTRFRPALLRDGHRVEIVANISNASEAAYAIENGAEGVGLLRTEFLFLNRDTAPEEAEQFSALCQMTDALNGLPLVVRTLDIGGDKAVPYLPFPHESNPFLGVRGIRLTLRHLDLFRTQLRAIFRASETGPIRLLFPMIGTLDEWRAARDFAETVRADLGVLPVEYGIMVEVPSAALLAREFAQEVDFFSIGTNDLTQYTLAVDRQLSREADALHPSVLRLIAMTVDAAKANGKRVSVCGNITDEPLGALILTGLGVDALSLSVPAIPTVKAALRQTDSGFVKALANRALDCQTSAEVRALGGQQ